MPRNTYGRGRRGQQSNTSSTTEKIYEGYAVSRDRTSVPVAEEKPAPQPMPQALVRKRQKAQLEARAQHLGQSGMCLGRVVLNYAGFHKALREGVAAELVQAAYVSHPDIPHSVPLIVPEELDQFAAGQTRRQLLHDAQGKDLSRVKNALKRRPALGTHDLPAEAQFVVGEEGVVNLRITDPESPRLEKGILATERDVAFCALANKHSTLVRADDPFVDQIYEIPFAVLGENHEAVVRRTNEQLAAAETPAVLLGPVTFQRL